MAYIAFAAASTLIVAAIIHSLWTRKQTEDTLTRARAREGSIKAPRQPEIRFEANLKDEVHPSVSIDISHDGDDAPSPISTSDSDSAESERITTVSQQRSDNAFGRIPQSKIIPPPPSAPSSTPPAAHVNKPAALAMPPPSSLPPSRTRSPPRLKPAKASSLAPPSRGAPQGGFAKPTGFTKPTSNSSALAPPPSAAAGLRVPRQKALNNTNMQPSLSLPTTSTQAPSKRSSKKVMLAPGHSPLDWAALTKSTAPDAPVKLRGQDATNVLGVYRLGRVTPSQLKYQNGRKGKDAWTVYQGRVYNISAYLDFHPGGRDELMKGAGRSSDQLFAEVHPWVNWEGMLANCMVGMLVSEDDPAAVAATTTGNEVVENDLDEMD